MNAISRELRHSSFRFSAVPLGVIAGIVGISNAYPVVATWGDTATVLVMAAAFTGPFWAGFGAWESLRDHRRELTSSERTAARSVLQIKGPQYGAALIWTAISTLIAFAIVTIRAAAIGLYDLPSILALSVPLVANLFSVTLGYVAGQLIHRWLAVVVAVIIVTAIYSIDLFPVQPSWVQALSPYHRVLLPEGTAFNPATFIGQLSFALGLTGILLSIALIVRAPEALRSLTATVASGALIFFGCTMVIGQQGQGFLFTTTPRMMTLTATNPQLTLHILPSYAPVADQLHASWMRVASLFEKSDLRFDSLTQDLNPTYGENPRGKPYRLDLNPNSDDIAGDSIDAMFRDVERCATGPVSASEGTWAAGPIVFQLWVRGDRLPRGIRLDPETSAAVDRLRQLTLPDAQLWVADHTEQIRSCQWRETDFP